MIGYAIHGPECPVVSCGTTTNSLHFSPSAASLYFVVPPPTPQMWCMLLISASILHQAVLSLVGISFSFGCQFHGCLSNVVGVRLDHMADPFPVKKKNLSAGEGNSYLQGKRIYARREEYLLTGRGTSDRTVYTDVIALEHNFKRSERSVPRTRKFTRVHTIRTTSQSTYAEETGCRE